MLSTNEDKGTKGGKGTKGAKEAKEAATLPCNRPLYFASGKPRKPLPKSLLSSVPSCNCGLPSIFAHFGGSGSASIEEPIEKRHQ